MNDKNLKKLYESVAPPDELRGKVTAAVSSHSRRLSEPQSSNPARLTTRPTSRPTARRMIPAIVIIMIVLTVTISAVTVLYNTYANLYMLPGMGVYDGINENVLAMPAVVNLGEATVEMAMVYEEDGIRKLAIEIWDNGEFNTPYDISLRTKYQNLEMLFPDGTSMTLYTEDDNIATGHGEGRDHYTYNSRYRFICENFPDQTEFVLNSPSLNENVAISLLPLAELNQNIMITENENRRILMIPAAEGSRLLSFTFEGLKLTPTELASNQVSYNFNIIGNNSPESDFINEVIYESGEHISLGGGFLNSTFIPIFSESGKNYNLTGEMSPREAKNEKIDKIIIRKLNTHISFDIINAELPIPKNNETLRFDEPILIGEIGEFAVYADAIGKSSKPKMDYAIYIKKDNIKYWGEEDIESVCLSFQGSNSGNYEVIEGEEYYVHHIGYTKKNPGGTGINLEFCSIQYIINGYWEIDY